jgi:oligoribonuclease
MKIESIAPYLIWVDMEMTGLNVIQDVILEVAVIVTDNNLDIVAEGPDIVIYQPDHILEKMDEWCQTQHGKSGLIEAVRSSTYQLFDAEQELYAFLKPFCPGNRGVLAGSSVWQDKAFIKKYMPRVNELLHYKIVDVSSVQELIKRWYKKSSLIETPKSETHRALADIKESIEQLRHYKNYFFLPPGAVNEMI